MNPTAPSAHSRHDELLIARLFGGDVTEVERARALDQMAECEECESLFADLGVMAEATVALPTPVRPRDFTLTEADGARLARRPRSRWSVFGLGLRRSFGAAVAALGIAGMVVAGTGSFISQTAFNGSAYQNEPAVAPDLGAISAASAGSGSKSGTVGPAVVATSAPTAASVAVTSVGPGQSGDGGNLSGASIVPQATTAASLGPMPSASDRHQLDVTTPGPTPNTNGSGPAGATSAPVAVTGAGVGPGSGSNGLDTRLLLVLGFAALFLAGLALAILPGRRSGRTRGAGA
jgi:hypothetical protein